GLMENYTLMAIPLFVFIGVMLERSKVAEDMLDVIGLAMGGLRGGMGLAIILVGVLMGASTGIVGATVVTLGLLTLPVFLRRGYSKSLACGTICASGTLGQIIPPSLVLILLSDILGQGLGTLFAAAMIPGLLLAAIYVVYLLMVGWLWPDMAPAISAEERAQVSKLQLLVKVIKVVVPPIGLIVAVLGSIIGGIAAPTEAASIGALGSILVALFARKLTWQVLTGTVRNTLRISAMVFFILICAQAFSLAFRGLDGDQLVLKLFELIPGGPTADIIFMLFLLFILGFFMEWIEISYIVLPLFLPILNATGADMVWIAILVCLVLQTSFLTPPVGWALFFLKGVAPPEVSSRDIYVGVMPYVLLQVVAVVLLFQYPAIATWLPKAIGW
ncbi:MAG: TRAP transporter large permease subunit, partial [Alphaproteobacteria bacterium]